VHFKKLQGNLEFHQSMCHPGDVPDKRRQCTKATNQWAQGVAGRPGFMSVWPAASFTHVYTRWGRPSQGRKSVEANPHGRPATWLGRSATTWRVTDLTKSVTPTWTPIYTPVRSAPHSSSAEALPECFGDRQGFLALVYWSGEVMSESYGFR
jgi:hypothetical protein